MTFSGKIMRIHITLMMGKFDRKEYTNNLMNRSIFNQNEIRVVAVNIASCIMF